VNITKYKLRTINYVVDARIIPFLRFSRAMFELVV